MRYPLITISLILSYFRDLLNPRSRFPSFSFFPFSLSVSTSIHIPLNVSDK